MPELTREEKLRLIDKLPQRLSDFLYSEDTGAFLLRLGKKYNLENDKISLLSKLVGDIVLGIAPITSLAQEINLKIISNAQSAMSLAQELNTELLAPVMAEAKPVVPIPAPPALSIPPAQIPDTKYQIPSTDRYREPTSSAPEIVDLRKTPPPPMPAPVAAAPIPPRPLTFTKPVPTRPERAVGTPTSPLASVGVEPLKPLPLIESEPHKKDEPPVIDRAEQPQFIVRPPGLSPIPTPHDVLDLRQDKGEF